MPYTFDLPLVKTIDWAKMFGTFVTTDICPSIHWASGVPNPQSCLHLASQRFFIEIFRLCSLTWKYCCAEEAVVLWSNAFSFFWCGNTFSINDHSRLLSIGQYGIR